MLYCMNIYIIYTKVYSRSPGPRKSAGMRAYANACHCDNCWNICGQSTRRVCTRSRCREVEHSSFTPFVLSATGGLAKEATVFYKGLASLLASKWDTPYSSALCWMRCRLGFSLLCSAIQSIRGARSSRGYPIKIPAAVDLVNTECNVAISE